jgi:hypothetical protein
MVYLDWGLRSEELSVVIVLLDLDKRHFLSQKIWKKTFHFLRNWIGFLD